MSVAEILNLGGGEIVLILALILILVGARKLPDLAKILAESVRMRRRKEPTTHPLLVAVTFVLGTICLILVLYELFK